MAKSRVTHGWDHDYPVTCPKCLRPPVEHKGMLRSLCHECDLPIEDGMGFICASCAMKKMTKREREIIERGWDNPPSDHGAP